MSLHDHISRMVRAEAQARSAAIERACEEALTGGICGVLVDDDRCSAGPSLAVPYGQVHYVGTPTVGWRQSAGRDGAGD